MGAKCLYKVATNADTGATQAERDIARRAESNRGIRVGPWEVVYTVWQDPERNRGNVEVVTTSEAPDHCYISTNGEVSSAGKDFIQVMSKFSALQQKSTVVIKGVEYDMKDFRVHVGRVFEKQNPTHVVVEVEYRPCLVVDECHLLMQELLEVLIQAPSRIQNEEEDMDEKSYQAQKISLEVKKSNAKDKTLFNLKHAASLYMKLLTNSQSS